jgi:hypothetical protein
MDAYTPQKSITAKLSLSKKAAYLIAQGKLSPTALGFNEIGTQNCMIATKKNLTKRLGKCVCYNGSRHIVRQKKFYNHYI